MHAAPDAPAAPPALRVVALALLLPTLLSWGLGTTSPLLDALAAPGSLVLALPAAMGRLGVVAIGGATLLSLRPGRAGQIATAITLGLGALGGLTWLGSALAATRPLPWLGVGAALFVAFGPDSRRPRSAWSFPPASLKLGAVVCLLAGSRVRPFGPGLLPPGLEDAVALWVGGFGSLAMVLPVGCAVIVAALLARRAAPSLRGAAVGATLAILLEQLFGNGAAWGSALALGGLAGAWPPIPARGRPFLASILPLLLLCGLASLRLGTAERWRCDDAAADPLVKVLRGGTDATAIAIAPGNLAYLAVIVEDGRTLQRLTVTGAVGAEAVLEPPGGTLLSPLEEGGSVLRIAPTGDDLVIEWWDIPRLNRRARATLGRPCAHPSAAPLGHEDAVLVSCDDGALLRVAPDASIDQLPDVGWTPAEVLTGGVLLRREGAWGAVAVLGAEGGIVSRAALGPYASGVGTAPGLLFVTRGPAGHLEVRGLPPLIPTMAQAPSDPSARLRQSLRHRLDSVRVGSWPGEAHYVVPQAAVYVTSPVDPFATLVDLEVTWHQRSASLGAPPRAVAVDSGSGRLYAANRCGVLAVRVHSTFPWD